MSTHFKTTMERTLFALLQYNTFRSYNTLKAKTFGLVIHDRILLKKGTKVDDDPSRSLNSFLLTHYEEPK